MTFRRYLALSTDHPDPEISALARDYGMSITGETVADVRRELLPWADYDQAGALDRAAEEFAAVGHGQR